jgi:hypothetical protein
MCVYIYIYIYIYIHCIYICTVHLLSFLKLLLICGTLLLQVFLLFFSNSTLHNILKIHLHYIMFLFYGWVIYYIVHICHTICMSPPNSKAHICVPDIFSKLHISIPNCWLILLFANHILLSYRYFKYYMKDLCHYVFTIFYISLLSKWHCKLPSYPS